MGHWKTGYERFKDVLHKAIIRNGTQTTEQAEKVVPETGGEAFGYTATWGETRLREKGDLVLVRAPFNARREIRKARRAAEGRARAWASLPIPKEFRHHMRPQPPPPREKDKY